MDKTLGTCETIAKDLTFVSTKFQKEKSKSVRLIKYLK